MPFQTDVLIEDYDRVFDYLAKWDRDALVESVIEGMSMTEFKEMNDIMKRHAARNRKGCVVEPNPE